MMRALHVLVCLATANAAIDTSRFENPNTFRQKATYGDVLKAMFLVDFNLSFKDIGSLQLFTTPTDTEPEPLDGWLQAVRQMELFSKTMAAVKSDVEEAVKLPFYNALYLVINYEAMGQILDPNYEPVFFNFTRAINRERPDSLVLGLLNARWSVDLTGVGISTHRRHQKVGVKELALHQFYEGSEEEVEERRRQVYRMYLRLDEFVLSTLQEAYWRYPLSPNVPVPYIPPGAAMDSTSNSIESSAKTYYYGDDTNPDSKDEVDRVVALNEDVTSIPSTDQPNEAQ